MWKRQVLTVRYVPLPPWGGLGGTIGDGYLFWTVGGATLFSPPIGSGLLDLTTGQELPFPSNFPGPSVVSPNDQLYVVGNDSPSGYPVYLWSHGQLIDRGVVSDPRVDAVDASGAA